MASDEQSGAPAGSSSLRSVAPRNELPRATPTAAGNGEIALLQAVLSDASTIHVNHRPPSSLLKKREFCNAERWLASADVVWPFSFTNVCSALDLDPKQVRERVVAIRLRQEDATSERRWRAPRRGHGRQASLRPSSGALSDGRSGSRPPRVRAA